MGNDVRQQIIGTIIKLREHARSVAATFPDEAETFRRKAIELMHQHGISHAEIRSAAAVSTKPDRESSERPGTVDGRGRAQTQAGPPLTIEVRIGGFRARWKL